MAKKYGNFKCHDCTHRNDMCRGIKKEQCLFYEKEKTLMEMFLEKIGEK